jgi:hypothetical protein
MFTFLSPLIDLIMIIKSPLRESSHDCPTMQVNRPSRPELGLLYVSTQANTELDTLLTTLRTSPQIRSTDGTMCSDAHCSNYPCELDNGCFCFRQNFANMRGADSLSLFRVCLFLCLLLSFFSIYLFLSLFTGLCFFRFMTLLSIHPFLFPSFSN